MEPDIGGRSFHAREIKVLTRGDLEGVENTVSTKIRSAIHGCSARRNTDHAARDRSHGRLYAAVMDFCFSSCLPGIVQREATEP
jgi:hypothetical protein